MNAPAVLRTPDQSWPVVTPPAETMLAVVMRAFGGPEVLELASMPTPRPAPGEVLVQVAAVSVGRLLDVAARAGRHPYQGFTFPHVLGAEHAGVVAAVGEGVDPGLVGQRVAAFPVVTDGTCRYCLAGYDEICTSLQLIGMHRPGAYAQYAVVPARNVHAVPASLSPAEVTSLALAGAVAMNQLFRAGFAPGQWVLVQGASGALGSLTAALVQHLGGHVIAGSRSSSRRDALLALGAEAVVDSQDDDLADEVRRITGGHGADIVVDNLGEPSVWQQSQASLAPGGALVCSGSFLGREADLDVQRLYLQGHRVLGVRTGNRASVAALWAEVDRGFRPVIDTTFPLADAEQAHRALESDQTIGRVALLVSPTQNHEGEGPGA